MMKIRGVNIFWGLFFGVALGPVGAFAAASVPVVLSSAVSYRKTASASSVYSADYAAAKAVDGLISAQDEESRWCSGAVGNADAAKSPWLEVDLGAAYSLSHVTVTSGKYGADFLRGFELQYRTSATEAYRAIPGAAVSGNTAYQRDIVPTSAVNARYVRLLCQQGSASDNLCRVQELSVYGTAAATPPPASTPALGDAVSYLKAASASSIYSADYPAAKAVDGLIAAQDDESRWCSSTAGNADASKSPWLEVDLQKSYALSYVLLTTGKFGGDFMRGFQLQYRNSTTEAYQTVPGSVVAGNASYQRDIVPASAVTARYVRLLCQQGSASDNLCRVQELSIYGTVAAPPSPSPSAPPAANKAPTANAGADQTLTLPTNALVLAGAGADADGSIASYAWTKVSGGAATLANAATAKLSLSGLAQGAYTFRLTVRDNLGASASDDVVVTVNPAPSAPSGAYGTQTAVPNTSTRFGSRPLYGYYEYLPADYGKDPNRKWPVIFMLHGTGETGNGNTELSKLLGTGLTEVIQNKKFPGSDTFVVISPQTWAYFTPSYFHDFVEQVKGNYRVDTTRMYVTGLSYGAFAIWDYLDVYGTNGQFAAVAPVSGNGMGYDYCSFKNVPIWAFHGSADANGPTSVENEIDPIQALNRCSPAPAEKAKITVYVGTGHGEDTWNATYDLTGMKKAQEGEFDPYNQSLYDWFLQHHK